MPVQVPQSGDGASVYTVAEVDALLAKYYSKAQLDALRDDKLASYYTKGEVDALLAKITPPRQ